MRLRRSSEKGPGPSAPHRFVPRRDARSALALGALNTDLQMATPLAVANASLIDPPCAMPGCGKPREHPIHEPVE